MKVVVIGSGVIGAAAADALAGAGAHVIALDMRSAGRGASQASAGILAPYVEAHGETPLLDMGVRSLALYDDWVAGVTARSGVSVPYARTGTLEVISSAADQARLATVRDWLRQTGVDHEWLDASGVRAKEPGVSPRVEGGLFIGLHGWVGVSALVRALVLSARAQGATFESPVEAVSVESTDVGVTIRSATRRWEADVAVLAAGSWSGRVRVKGAAPLAVRPVRGQLLHIRCAPDACPSRVLWSDRCYAVPWADDSLLVGATVEDAGFDERATLEAMRELSDAAIDLWPAARHAAFEAVRVGLRPASADGLPIVGPLAGAPRVIAATGHYRNGILLAPLTARRVVELCQGGGA